MRNETRQIWIVEFAGKHQWVPVGEPFLTLHEALRYADEQRGAISMTNDEYRVTRFIKPSETRRKRKLFRGSK